MHAQANPKRPDVNVNLKLHTFWECNASLGREVPLMFAALCRLDSGRYAPCVQLAMRSEDHERITPRPAGRRPRPAVGGAADPGGRASGSCSRGC